MGTNPPLSVTIEPWSGLSPASGPVGKAAMASAAVKAAVQGHRHRLIATQMIHPDVDGRTRTATPREFSCIVYDYDANRQLVLRGRIDRPQEVTVSERGGQPLPSQEERDAALGILAGDPDFGPKLRDGSLTAFRPMPPVTVHDPGDPSPERVVTVGLRGDGPMVTTQIVGVNMVRDEVVRFPQGAPAAAIAAPNECGMPSAGQGTTASDEPGAARIVVKQGATVLWRLLVIRPTASSGETDQRSAIELREVDFRGQRVLRRAHVPILNVRYAGDACGPYRDWQWEEGMFRAVGADPAPGFRMCGAPAKTALDAGQGDTGNFRGVAVYVEGDEVVLVSELEAGWYRYISQWRLHRDGTIRPRFGFTATQNPCVCNVHNHHVYWRLNFDVDDAGQNRVQEFNKAAGGAKGAWTTLRFEGRRKKNAPTKRRWRVTNAPATRGYEIVPGTTDGVSDDAFGVGDFWALRLRPGQIHDGVTGVTGTPADVKAQIDRFVNNESIDGQDVVLWYAAHFRHVIQASDGSEHGHVVGPELRPFGW